MVIKTHTTVVETHNEKAISAFRFLCHDVSTWRRVMLLTHVQNLWWHVAFKVLRNGLIRYKLNTCPNLWWHSCSKCFAIDSFGTYLTHAQTCDDVRVKVRIRNGLHRYIPHTCPKLWCNRVSKCYGVDCFGTYFTHAQSCDVTRVSKCYGMDCFCTYFTHVQSCDVTRVQSATEWTASVHSSHMSKAVM